MTMRSLVLIVGLSLSTLAQAGRAPIGWVRIPAHPIEKGGVGKVYKGNDVVHKPFAVKFNDDAAVSAHEAEVLKKLSGYDGWPHYHGRYGNVFQKNRGLITDWAHGETLEKIGVQHQPTAVQIVRQLLTHLGELHRRGYVHRDIKPRNIFFDAQRGAESTTLIDFGLTERIGTTVHGEGTPAFCAPEQWRAGKATPSSDLYGAAGVLAFLLTGRLPFQETERLVEQGVNRSDLERIHEQRDVLRSVTDPSLRAVLHKGLSPNPADRYESAKAFRDALAPFAG